MFRAIGLILVIWFLSTLFASSFTAFDKALTATFSVIETAALVREQELNTQ